MPEPANTWIVPGHGPWLAPFVASDDSRSLNFRFIPDSYEHDSQRRRTDLYQWLDYLKHGRKVWATANQVRVAEGFAGILTLFPQIPAFLGFQKRFSTQKIPIVAWTFNLGRLPKGIRQNAARLVFSQVDLFVVHSTFEIDSCSNWLALPKERFKFVPLQRPVRRVEFSEDADEPFILSLGSAQRDYALLFRVLAELRYRTTVVCAPHAVAGLSVPANVNVRSNLSASICHELMQKARIVVIPVNNQSTASGQVTLIDTMMYGRPVVATACPGSVDYVRHGEDAILVPHGDFDAMREKISQLWESSSLRQRLGSAARHSAVQYFSDEAVGRVVGNVLRGITRNV